MVYTGSVSFITGIILSLSDHNGNSITETDFPLCSLVNYGDVIVAIYSFQMESEGQTVVSVLACSGVITAHGGSNSEVENYRTALP